MLIVSYVKKLLESKEFVPLSLEGVLSMDKMAARSIEELYTSAAKNSKVLLIFGNQNKNIFNVLGSTNTRYILSSDRV